MAHRKRVSFLSNHLIAASVASNRKYRKQTPLSQTMGAILTVLFLIQWSTQKVKRNLNIQRRYPLIYQNSKEDKRLFTPDYP